MKNFAFLLIATTFAAVGVGCAPPRELIKPDSTAAKEIPYIYFVEQEQKTDSRLQRCEINADNTAKCAVMFDLK